MRSGWFEVVSDEFEASKGRWWTLRETGIHESNPKDPKWVAADTEYATLSRLRNKLWDYK